MNSCSKRLLPLRSRRARRGFSLIELLIAVIIIAILVAVLIPIVGGRTSQARIARASVDLENITEAQQRVAIDTGYHVRIFALNDVRGSDAATLSFERPASAIPLAYVDGLAQYTGTSSTSPGDNFFRNSGNQLFIDPQTNTFISAAQGAVLRQKLLRSETSYDPTRVAWNGPYLQFNKDNNLLNGIEAPDGIPDDPWGNDYVLFSPLGVFLEPDGVLEQNSVGVLTSGGLGVGASTTFPSRVFDRLTVLSLGPDGVPGDGTVGSRFGAGDDLSRGFGK